MLNLIELSAKIQADSAALRDKQSKEAEDIRNRLSHLQNEVREYCRAKQITLSSTRINFPVLEISQTNTGYKIIALPNDRYDVEKLIISESLVVESQQNLEEEKMGRWLIERL